MSRVLVFLHDTYADWELGYILPELRAAEHEVTTFALEKGPLRSLGGLVVTPDQTIDVVEEGDVLLLPGGVFWRDFSSVALDDRVRRFQGRGALIAAICGATGYLARLSLLDGAFHTSNNAEFLKERAPSYRGERHYRRALAVRDGNLITASGLGAVDFTREIMSALDMKEVDIWYRAFKHGEEPASRPTRYVVFLTKVPERSTSPETIVRHVEFLRQLDEEGILRMSGPFADHPSGLVVLDVPSMEEARAVAERDPFVVEGVRTYEVRTWLLAHRENGYLLRS